MEGQTAVTQTAPAVSGSEPLTLLDVEIDIEAVDVDEIMPLAGADAQTCLDVLDARRAVGELLYAREEDFAMADLHEVEAEAQEERAAAAKRDLDARRLKAEARRNRILAGRSRWRARHRELTIIAHLKRQGG